jgi:hypothetical protein
MDTQQNWTPHSPHEDPETLLVPFPRQDVDRLWSRFGYATPGNSRAVEAVQVTTDRWKRIYGKTEHRHVDQLLFRRETVKVLAGHVFHAQVDRALRKVQKPRRTRLFKEVVGRLRPGGNETDPGDPFGFLDPGKWDVAGVTVCSPNERHLRLSLFVSAMISQERGFWESSEGQVDDDGPCRALRDALVAAAKAGWGATNHSNVGA